MAHRRSVVMVGAVDVLTACRYDTVIRSLLADPDTSRIDVDCSHVRYIDAGGLAILFVSQLACERAGVCLRLRRVPDNMLRLLDATAATGLFEITSTGWTARLAAADPPR